MNIARQKNRVYVTSLGMVNALGFDKKEVLKNLLNGISPGMRCRRSTILGKDYYCGIVDHQLPKVPQNLSDYDCRNNQLALAAVLQIKDEINKIVQYYSRDRVGVVMGTSTSGIAESEQAINAKINSGQLPESFDYKMQEFGALSDFVARYLDICGPSYSISTACSSSGKVFASARRLLDLDICDAVIVGGIDSLCDLTLGGFDSLEAISNTQANPFSRDRHGINIGEAAAVFTLTKKPHTKSDGDIDLDYNIELLGVGETSDAYHMSAPEPEGAGAISAMKIALDQAQLCADDIDYVNLHGTGTRLNDAMEAFAMNRVFGNETQCSSTKPLTGHTLGAAGATEIGLCWLLLDNKETKQLAPHVYDGQYDTEIEKIQLVPNDGMSRRCAITMSNSFAFGGNNVSVILGVRN